MDVMLPSWMMALDTFVIKSNFSADEGGGVAGKNYRVSAVRKGVRGPDYFVYVFVFLGRIIVDRTD